MCKEGWLLSPLTLHRVGEYSQVGFGGSSEVLASVSEALWQIAHFYLDVDFHVVC